MQQRLGVVIQNHLVRGIVFPTGDLIRKVCRTDGFAQTRRNLERTVQGPAWLRKNGLIPADPHLQIAWLAVYI